MRRVLFVVFLLVASVTSVNAQGIQYRMTMKTSAGGFGGMPSPEMLVSTDGSRMRMDMTVEMPGMEPMHMSTIMDPDSKKAVMLQHEGKTYFEMPMPNLLSSLDTATMRQAAKAVKTTKDSSARDVIEGRAVRRTVTVADFPMTKSGFPRPKVEEGKRAVMVSEQWVSDDPALAAAAKKMMKVAGENGLPDEIMKAADEGGFPLRSTMMIIQVPKDAIVDGEALLKAGDKGNGVIMLTSMSITEIKIGPVDPALFQIPKGYTKR